MCCPALPLGFIRCVTCPGRPGRRCWIRSTRNTLKRRVHALRNALIPVITYLGPQIAFTLCGGLVVETVFSIPGLGRYFIQSIQNRDYPLIMGTTIFLAAFIIIMNLLVDVCYKIVDPRINLTRGN